MAATAQRADHADELDKVVPIDVWQKRTAPSVLIGVADIPQAQKARSGYRSVKDEDSFTEVQTVRPRSYRHAMDHFRKAYLENLTMYLLDFGTNGEAA